MRKPVAESYPYRFISYAELQPTAVQEMIELVGHEPFSPPTLEVVVTTINNTAVSSPNGRLIGVGIAATVVVTAVTRLVWQRKRRLS
jgi:hypothetical protein